MTSEKPPLRDKDKAVLNHIKEGRDDIQKITEATTLENHEVNYCFQKLEKLGLIEVEKPDGMVERVVDGQKRVFEAPKRAELTEQGVEYNERDKKITSYNKMSQSEIVEKVRVLEDDIEALEEAFQTFKSQIQREL